MQESKRGSARGRGRGRGAGRGKRGRRVVSSDEESPNEVAEVPAVDPPAQGVITTDASTAVADSAQPMDVSSVPDTESTILEDRLETTTGPPPIDIEADISQLEAPTFTTITRGPPEPMLRLKWNHKVLLIGEKVLNPMIHSCDTCLLPILHYGRMIPCKHVFCLMCAKREPVKECPRCKDKVCRVEQSGLGSVFMCTHGGSRYNNKGCRRTYLSQRDLQAHINHRHVAVAANAATGPTTVAAAEKSSATPSASSIAGGRKSLGSTTPNISAAPPMTNSVRTNLMNMQQDNLTEDTHYPPNNNPSSRHSRYSNYDNPNINWSSSNYR